jgi:RimJ/RimL family protein N-acetyltransferase
MTLRTPRLELKPLSSEDYKDIHAMNSYSQVARYNTMGVPLDLAETTTLLEKVMLDERALVWVIRELETAEFVGEIGLKLSSEKYKKGEIYYSLHPDRWGQGYATEALKTVINYGFSDLNLHRLEAGVATENFKSVALLERVGMTREGLCRKILPLQSGWADNYMYALLQEDPRDY